jgi:hypothetical protein
MTANRLRRCCWLLAVLLWLLLQLRPDTLLLLEAVLLQAPGMPPAEVRLLNQLLLPPLLLLLGEISEALLMLLPHPRLLPPLLLLLLLRFRA